MQSKHRVQPQHRETYDNILIWIARLNGYPLSSSSFEFPMGFSGLLDDAVMNFVTQAGWGEVY